MFLDKLLEISLSFTGLMITPVSSISINTSIRGFSILLYTVSFLSLIILGKILL